MIYTKEYFKENFGLTQTSFTVPAPTPKLYNLEIPGRDGSLDLTEFFGEVLYGNQEAIVRLETLMSREEFLTKARLLMSEIHGKEIMVKESNNEEAYYKGRVALSIEGNTIGIKAINISITAEPYRYKNDITTVTIEGTGEAQDVTLENWQKKVAPKIWCGEATNVSIKREIEGEMVTTFTKDFAADTEDQYVGIYLEQGDNDIIVTTTGDVTFKYQERGL